CRRIRLPPRQGRQVPPDRWPAIPRRLPGPNLPASRSDRTAAAFPIRRGATFFQRRSWPPPVVTGGLEGLTEFLAGVKHAGLDGRDRNAEDLADLAHRLSMII